MQDIVGRALPGQIVKAGKSDRRYPVPDGVDEAKVRSRLLEMGVEMGGGLGALAGKVWRVGVMGYNAQQARVEQFVDALAFH